MLIDAPSYLELRFKFGFLVWRPAPIKVQELKSLHGCVLIKTKPLIRLDKLELLGIQLCQQSMDNCASEKCFSLNGMEDGTNLLMIH